MLPEFDFLDTNHIAQLFVFLARTYLTLELDAM